MMGESPFMFATPRQGGSFISAFIKDQRRDGGHGRSFLGPAASASGARGSSISAGKPCLHASLNSSPAISPPNLFTAYISLLAEKFFQQSGRISHANAWAITRGR
jgi:hypothetical protein